MVAAADDGPISVLSMHALAIDLVGNGILLVGSSPYGPVTGASGGVKGIGDAKVHIPADKFVFKGLLIRCKLVGVYKQPKE
jgi:hypothetical protein